MGTKIQTITVQGVNIAVTTIGEEDYISLTDMIRAKDGDFFITDWLRNKNTLEYIGAWEAMYNPNFNYGEFAIIKSEAGLNSFKISVKEWVNITNAIFQLYIVKEYQRLKEIESNQYNIEWSCKRVISKANYRIHTDAIKKKIIPQLSKWESDWIYADEADMLNIIILNSKLNNGEKRIPSVPYVEKTLEIPPV